MKRLLFAAACFLSAPAFASQTPDELYDSLLPIVSKYPEISQVEVCVNGTCANFDVLAWERKGGSAELLYQAPKLGGDEGGVARAVGEIVGSVGSKVGAGGRVVVDYHKKPDGEVTVHVEASFGVGSAAEAAATAPTTDK